MTLTVLILFPFSFCAVCLTVLGFENWLFRTKVNPFSVSILIEYIVISLISFLPVLPIAQLFVRGYKGVPLFCKD